MNDFLFFDSYAIIEVLKANENYTPYKDTTPIITKLNLFEVYYALLRETNKKEADTFMKEYSYCVVDFNENTIKEATILKLKYKKRKLSMTDCLGYIIAKRYGIKFLTGDKEFEKFDNVEFMK